jgi:hypothetical protein
VAVGERLPVVGGPATLTAGASAMAVTPSNAINFLMMKLL